MSSTSTRAKKRPRATIADIEEAAVSSNAPAPRTVGIIISLLVAAAAVGVAVWQPPRLLDMFAPAWATAGPSLMLLLLLVLTTYVLIRLFGILNLRVWRFAFGAALAIGATVIALNLFEITAFRGVPLETGSAENVLALATWMKVGMLVALCASILALASPYGALVTARLSGRASRAASVAGARAARVGGSAAGRGSAKAVSLGAERASLWLHNSRGGGRSSATDDVLLAQTQIPRSRIVVSDTPSGARTTNQNRYPAPMGALRDEAKARHEARMAEKQSESNDATPQDSGQASSGMAQQPRIVMPGGDTSGQGSDPAQRNGSTEPPQDLTGAAKAAREAEMERSGVNGIGELDANQNPVNLAGGAGAPAVQEVIGSEANGESDGISDYGDDSRAPVDSADDAEDMESAFGSPATTDIADEDENEWESESIDDELTDDDDEEWESDALNDDAENPAPNYERSDAEILASRDPFAGLPKVDWQFPSVTLFEEGPPQKIDTDSHLETAEAIRETLQEYGIEVEVSEVRPGPTVTLYGLRPGWDRRYRTVRERNAEGAIISRREEVGRTRVKVDAIAKLDDDLALQLKAGRVRIEPIAGTNLVGVEVPNVEPETVYMRPQLESDTYQNARSKSKLAFPLGKGSGGEHLFADLARMPHLLVAGSTGSGKSVFVNSMITSIITQATPEEVRFVMVDPKRVELTIYNGIPHLITPVIVDTQKVVNALQWIVQQMEERLQSLAEEGARDIGSYNEKMSGSDRMPFLVLIVDELADLMMTAGKAVEHGLVRLAQMGRATGIHLVVATQRPSVNVITGLIKANFPTRISFMVTSLVDSRTILDGSGAEKLLGRGDMLYLPQDASRPVRIQSAFLSSPESDAIVDDWKEQSGGYVPPELPDLATPEDIGLQSKGRSGLDDAGYTQGSKRTGGGAEDIMQQAKALAELYNGKVSTSLLQRRLGIGYPRAARLRDTLVEEGLANADIPNAPSETGGRGLRKARMDDD